MDSFVELEVAWPSTEIIAAGPWIPQDNGRHVRAILKRLDPDQLCIYDQGRTDLAAALTLDDEDQYLVGVNGSNHDYMYNAAVSAFCERVVKRALT